MCLGMTLDSSISMVVTASIVYCLPRPARETDYHGRDMGTNVSGHDPR